MKTQRVRSCLIFSLEYYKATTLSHPVRINLKTYLLSFPLWKTTFHLIILCMTSLEKIIVILMGDCLGGHPVIANFIQNAFV